jgi:hypothetical protein
VAVAVRLFHEAAPACVAYILAMLTALTKEGTGGLHLGDSSATTALMSLDSPSEAASAANRALEAHCAARTSTKTPTSAATAMSCEAAELSDLSQAQRDGLVLLALPSTGAAPTGAAPTGAVPTTSAAKLAFCTRHEQAALAGSACAVGRILDGGGMLARLLTSSHDAPLKLLGWHPSLVGV